MGRLPPTRKYRKRVRGADPVLPPVGSGKLEIRQTRSGSGKPASVRRTLEALGLKHHQDVVVHSDHPGPARSGLQEHAAGAVIAHDLVRDCAAGERNLRHAAAGGLHGLPHRFADLVRFAGRDPDLTFAIPHRNQSVEGETAATLHDFRDAIDGDDVLDHAVALAPLAAIVAPLTAAASASAATTTTATTTTTTLAAGTARRPRVLHFGDRRSGRSRRRSFRTVFLFFH